MNEIMNGVVLGMGRLDTEFQDGHQDSDPRGTARGGAPRSGAPSPEDRPSHQAHQANNSLETEKFVYSQQEGDVMQKDPTAIPENIDQGYYGTLAHAPGQEMDEEGWISSLPRTPDQEILQMGTFLEPQILGTIEEEPASNDTGDEATVGRVASMSVVAAIAANGQLDVFLFSHCIDLVYSCDAIQYAGCICSGGTAGWLGPCLLGPTGGLVCYRCISKGGASGDGDKLSGASSSSGNYQH